MEPSTAPTPWKVFDQLSEAQFQAFRQAGIEPIQAQLLFNRGIETADAMRAFLDTRYEQTPDPLTLIDMPRAVARIRQALNSGEHITVYGDYDADGVTSSALLTRALRTLKQPGALLDYYIPSRLSEGCGLNIPALDALKARGTSLIITTDCASSDVEQVAYATSLGIDVIITDHHSPPERRPDAYAMVNPWRPDSTYNERYLCGAGVAFKLVQALYRAYGTREEELSLLDLVAFGTIADIAPLLGENHTLVRLGMQQLNATRTPGLLALIRRANLQLGRIRERDIAYALAPRINAAGRMEHASIAFELLTTDSEEEAHRYAEKLEMLNLARQQQTEELMRSVREQAQQQVNNQVVLVRGENWHEGIIGLVAGRLAEEINRPVLVLSEDKETKLSRGSARSQQGFNIILALRGFAPMLVRYGGHAQAAGFTIESDRVEDLHRYLLDWKEEELSGHPQEPPGHPQGDAPTILQAGDPLFLPEPVPVVDLVFTRLELLNYSTYSKIRALAPFGAANPEPTFKMEGLRLVDRWTSGQEGRNLRLRLAAGNVQRTGTFVRGGGQLQSLVGVTHVNIIFRIDSSWSPLDNESKQDVWLKILYVEPVQ